MNHENEILVRLFVENRAEELIAEGIFAEFVRTGSLKVRMSWTSSSAISLAESWLLTTPNVYVAVALNCSGNAEEFRTPIENILSRDAGSDRWHVAVAVPDMTKWLLLDPNFAKSVDENRIPRIKGDLAVHFKGWSGQSGAQFDRDEVSNHDAEFAALNEFIEKHVAAVSGTVES